MDVVVNRRYGGFGLSKDAFIEVMRRKGRAIEARDGKWGWEYFEGDKPVYQTQYTDEDAFRADPDLIAVVREMGEAANGDFASLEIVTVPDDVQWAIQEYDGREWVAESHRIW